MTRFALALLLLGLPVWAGAQAFKCPDPMSGGVLYTDQPCAGGEAVVPARTPEQVQQDAQRAEAARERTLQQREQALQREQQRLDEARAAAEAARPPATLAESAECRAARAEASFRAASVTATEEQIRTARANAALACGQPAPPEIVVAPPAPRWGWNTDVWPPHHVPARPHVRPPQRPPIPPRPHPQTPPQPQYAPGTEPLPMR